MTNPEEVKRVDSLAQSTHKGCDDFHLPRRRDRREGVLVKSEKDVSMVSSASGGSQSSRPPSMLNDPFQSDNTFGPRSCECFE